MDKISEATCWSPTTGPGLGADQQKRAATIVTNPRRPYLSRRDHCP